MAVTYKVSVAMGVEELRLARLAAEADGMSLSAFVTDAVRDRLAERRRLDAAREVLATFSPDELATPAEQRALLARWTRGAEPAAGPRRRRRG
jgi:hypothetical protein